MGRERKGRKGKGGGTCPLSGGRGRDCSGGKGGKKEWSEGVRGGERR